MILVFWLPSYRALPRRDNIFVCLERSRCLLNRMVDMRLMHVELTCKEISIKLLYTKTCSSIFWRILTYKSVLRRSITKIIRHVTPVMPWLSYDPVMTCIFVLTGVFLCMCGGHDRWQWSDLRLDIHRKRYSPFYRKTISHASNANQISNIKYGQQSRFYFLWIFKTASSISESQSRERYLYRPFARNAHRLWKREIFQ